MSAARWSAAFCAGFAKLRPLIDAGPDALLELPGPPLGEQPRGPLVTPVAATTTAASDKADLVARFDVLAFTAKDNTAVLKQMGPPDIAEGAAIVGAFVASEVDIQVELEQLARLARSLPTSIPSSFLQARDDLANQVTHWADASNVEMGRAWALDQANGAAIHRATSADPICRMWSVAGD